MTDCPHTVWTPDPLVRGREVTERRRCTRCRTIVGLGPANDDGLSTEVEVAEHIAEIWTSQPLAVADRVTDTMIAHQCGHFDTAEAP